MTRLSAVIFGVWLIASPILVFAQLPPTAESQSAGDQDRSNKRRGDVLADAPDTATQLEQLKHAAVRLPIAAALASVLALRPRGRGTPKRQPAVIQTQIILAIVGAVVMLVVGSSLARAFGIVGAAGLVRYRAKIEDPKDAGVMLSTLAIGLAAGVGLWMLGSFATVFILGVLWIIESAEPKARHLFTLTVKTKEPAALKPAIEEILRRHQVKFEIRTESQDQLCYEARLPMHQKTDRLSDQILDIERGKATAVEWEEKKEKK